MKCCLNENNVCILLKNLLLKGCLPSQKSNKGRYAEVPEERCSLSNYFSDTLQPKIRLYYVYLNVSI